MPKQAARSAARSRRASRKRVTTRRAPARRLALPDDQAHIDGCDVDFNESDATPDAELPASTGGVETARRTERRTARRTARRRR